jgi:GntR family transcriptional regulator
VVYTSSVAAKVGAVHDRLAELLLARRPGDALPGERQLAEECGVSRMTLRRALDDLARRGLVERRHGAGTFVARPRVAQPLTATSFTEDMLRRGLKPSSRTVQSGTVAADAALAGRLEVPVGAPVLRARRVRLADDEPMAIEVLHVPDAVAPGLVAASLDNESFYAVLAGRYGHRVAAGVQTVEPVVTTRDDSAVLGVLSGSPALLMRRVSRDESGTVVEYVRAVYRGDRYRIEVRLTPPRLPSAGNGDAG